MQTERLWLRIEAMLLRLIEAHGESRNSLSQKLGRGRNYLSRYLRTEEDHRQDPDIEPAFSVAFEVAEYFGLRAPSLFALHEADSFDVLLGMLVCAEPLGHSASEMLWLCDSLGVILSPARDKRVSLGERCRGEPALGEVYRRLEEMEGRRHYAADQVARICLDRTRHLARSVGQLCLAESVEAVGLLGIWGSIQRCQGQLKSAQAAIQKTLKWSGDLGEPSLFASQLQRASYVFRDLGAATIGMRTLRLAGELFAADGNLIAEHRTLVDRAVMKANQGDLEYAEQLYRSALDRLSDDGSRNYRASAAVGIASCCQVRGDLDEALLYLGQASEEADARDASLRAHILWSAGIIEHQLHLYDEAERKYWAAINLFRQQERADWILMVAIDIALLLLTTQRFGGFTRIRELAQEYLPKARNFQELTGNYEIFLAELIRGPVDSRPFENLRDAMRRTRRAPGPPCLR